MNLFITCDFNLTDPELPALVDFEFDVHNVCLRNKSEMLPGLCVHIPILAIKFENTLCMCLGFTLIIGLAGF